MRDSRNVRPAMSAADIDERLNRLELPFNAQGLDPYGISRKHLRVAVRSMSWWYHHYFRVRTVGIENVPARGRAMLVCNHSGGVALDAALLAGACFFDMNPPRLAQGMVEKFLGRLPFATQWLGKTGQFAGLPEHAIRLLEDERLLMVFPEGARGTAKLFKERYSLVRFGTGFVRLALETRAPIIPVACLGAGAAIPTVTNLYGLGRLMGVPYIPLTPYLLPTPLPVQIELRFAPALHFEGSGNEDDTFINARVDEVKERILELISEGRRERDSA
ncbi:MAG TPA: lysophospholipid acyltransferase family protein [Polyangiaceae bacterium]